MSLDFVFIGLSITSSWGNGHATTYRALLRELSARGHRVLFLERDQPYYAMNRDMPHVPFARAELYGSVDALKATHAQAIADADVVVVGSYVADGPEIIEWVTSTARGITAFYDIDTPITLRKLEEGDAEYLEPSLVPRFDLYLSFTGGPTLGRIEAQFGARRAHALYCAVDPTQHHPEAVEPRWDMGYLGTYSADRQPTLDSLMLEPARSWTEGRFIVAGPMYPPGVRWPSNVERVDHLSPAEHRAFYAGQRFTLNVTRADMVRAGYSPSVRLFEAAACGTPILSDTWPGLDTFFVPGREILVARTPAEALHVLRRVREDERLTIGARARARVLAEHTAAHRAETLESIAREVLDRRSVRRGFGRAGALSESRGAP